MLTALAAGLPQPTATTPRRLARMLATTLRTLFLTLLFLTACGLRRTWELRGYTGTTLALLTGRARAYGYRHVERFLSQLARAGGAEPLTDALAGWTAQLWLPTTPAALPPTITVYVDAHRKAVYSDQRLPRGLIGRTGKVLGCRALVLLHDAQGHPLLVTTTRGDTHLSIGLPQILTRYEQVVGQRLITRIIVDREGMGAEFLAGLMAEGRVVVTLLRADQYDGLDSFLDVGTFVPLRYDREGKVLREVAPARFALPRPDRPGETLDLSVALVRDLGWQVPEAEDSEAAPAAWDADLRGAARDWRASDWEATPAPATPTSAKLIPIVATGDVGDAISLAQLYMQRWPRQENVIRDFLIPLGIDTNHGYQKTEVVNSEVAKRREALEERLARLKRWAISAGERCSRASKRYRRLWEQAKTRARELSRQMFAQQSALEAQELPEYIFRQQMREVKAAADAEMAERQVVIDRAFETSNQEFRKQERYCREQRQVLRALEDLAARERQMFELDNAKDQIMTVCKVALTNLAMWVREQYFPDTYRQATWKRLEPFFKLPGQVVWGDDFVQVTVHPFNDRALNRDLAAVCQRVSAAAPHLPDGRRLIFTLGGGDRLSLDGSSHPLA